MPTDSQYREYLASLGFGRGDTLFEQRTQARIDAARKEAEAQRQKAEILRRRSERDVNYDAEDRGIYNSGIRAQNLAEVETDWLQRVGDINRAEEADVREAMFGGMAAAKQQQLADIDYAYQQQLRSAQMQLLDQQLAQSGVAAQLANLQLQAAYLDVTLKQRMIDRISQGWGSS